jgi:hypothetical protein
MKTLSPHITVITHLTLRHTEFYEKPPWHQPSASGLWPPGTELQIVHSAGSYACVRSAAQSDVWVAADVLAAQPMQIVERETESGLKSDVVGHGRVWVEIIGTRSGEQTGSAFVRHVGGHVEWIDIASLRPHKNNSEVK